EIIVPVPVIPLSGSPTSRYVPKTARLRRIREVRGSRRQKLTWSLIVKLNLLIAALIFSTGAYAQEPPKAPTMGGKPLVRVKSKEAAGCTFIGTVRGTKLWAGDCAA